MVCIAESIVYRHPCDCASASRPLTNGEASEHRFDVDGEPFPYMIHENGAGFTIMKSGFWRVDVTIYPMLMSTREWVPVTADDRVPSLKIGGEEFPWVISEEGFTIRASRSEVLNIRLGFLAKNVDTDTAVHDETDELSK